MGCPHEKFFHLQVDGFRSPLHTVGNQISQHSSNDQLQAIGEGSSGVYQHHNRRRQRRQALQTRMARVFIIQLQLCTEDSIFWLLHRYILFLHMFLKL